jgi:hypothetical protein
VGQIESKPGSAPMFTFDTPCLTDFTFEFIRRLISPILSPSSRKFVELTLINWRRPWGPGCWNHEFDGFFAFSL